MTAGADWREIPAGEFTMGSDPAASYAPEQDEAPRHRLTCSAFRIGRTQVTNAEYGAFVAASGRPAPSHWLEGAPPRGRELHPVTYVSWSDAVAFCSWAGGFLPSEAQWERAARGDDDRTWPWGDELPDVDRATFGATDTSPTGLHPLGASQFGALDLAGNVWEWTSSVLRPYPLETAHGEEDTTSPAPRVVRGGAYSHGPGELRCSYRQGMLPGAVDHYVGFRLACATEAAPAIKIDLVDVPVGDVLLGNDPRPSAGIAIPDEVPQHTMSLPAFALGTTPVTNAQYLEFVRATGHPPPPHWADSAPPRDRDHHPVTYVDWFDASDYCSWADARLPTEAEWEKGARGTDGRLYPWGSKGPGAALANLGGGTKQGITSAVFEHPLGASPYGVLDMAGNVWEWVTTVYAEYPYRADDGREDSLSRSPRVLRGGSFASMSSTFVRCASRSRSAPGRRSAHIGFRAARDLRSSPSIQEDVP